MVGPEREGSRRGSVCTGMGTRVGWVAVLVVVIALIPGAARAGDATIAFPVGGFAYSPSTVTITAGQSVTWNGSFSNHPLVSVEGLWATPNSGTTFTQTFDTPGTYHFYCQFHGSADGSGMAGTITVNAAGQTTTATTTTTTSTTTPTTTTQTTTTGSTTTTPVTSTTTTGATPPSPSATTVTTTSATAAPDVVAPTVVVTRPRSLAVLLALSEPGRATAVLRAGTVVLARGATTFTAAGRRTLRLALTASGRTRRAAAGGRIAGTLTVRVVDAAGNTRSVTRHVTLRA